MVPHITSADEARNVVDMVRCRPMGSKALDATALGTSLTASAAEPVMRATPDCDR